MTSAAGLVALVGDLRIGLVVCVAHAPEAGVNLHELTADELRMARAALRRVDVDDTLPLCETCRVIARGRRAGRIPA